MKIQPVQHSDFGQHGEMDHPSQPAVRAAGAPRAEDGIGAAILRVVGHELRTPLNSIIGFAGILASGRALDEDERIEYARFIEEGGQELLEKVNALLDLARIEAGNYPLCLEVFDAYSIIHDCCRSVLSGAEMGMEIAEECDEILLRADRGALIEILKRLIANALEFSGEDGEVSVSVSRDGEGVVFKVSDNGCGMSPAFLSRLGAPFHQEVMEKNRQREGTGIGLSIVKGLVNLHDGTFVIDSRPNHGTTVSVWLPARMGGQETASSWALSA